MCQVFRFSAGLVVAEKLNREGIHFVPQCLVSVLFSIQLGDRCE
jgi:hypothetical protein